ncbi:S24 family peptidase [Vreelandella aquamarina]|jgi:phage repressor protein C with HTH and peptisase S24 domain|uniref:HTH cro/C1-type domain-containing protein n=1 Tax=Vreelandella aquamarina TaxID=77097 RepID=A0A857GGS3_9GAMM|nr:S24 family peptidase [Halomonas meridiana]QHD48463.1 hypothetical protein CTT34_01500 [Halomonas meridiana]
MSDQAERIKSRRTQLRLTQREVAARVGVTRESISQWEKNSNQQLGSHNLERLAKVLQTTAAWILTGKREKATTSSNVVPMHSKNVESTLMEPLLNEHAEKGTSSADYRIPILAVTASAGHGAVVLSEETTAYMEVPRAVLRAIGIEPSPHLRIISTRGDSMMGTLGHGDFAIIDVSVREMQDDGVYIFQLDGQVHVKRLQHLPGNRIRVISDNTLYPSYEMDETDNFQICARFLGRWAFGRM